MAYIALRRLAIGNGWREPGEPVPEAATWPNLAPWISGGYVKEVPDSEAPPPLAEVMAVAARGEELERSLHDTKKPASKSKPKTR